MERLLILTADGRKVLERELAAEKGPLLVVASAGGGLSLAASAAAGDDVLGALVRGEDGWSLASAKAGADVVSGPKRASAQPMLAGQQLALGGYVFKLEGEASQSGRVLVWRLGRSPVAADAVLSGRNVVTFDAAAGAAAVNPPIQDDVLFEFYPGVHGVEVVSRAGDHLTVAPDEAFELGDFRAIVLPRADAAAAMKTRNPFAWPSRKARRVLALSAAAILGVLLFAGLVNWRAAALESHAQSGLKLAQRAEARAHLDVSVLDDDKYLFMFTFYRDLPLILQAKESLVTHDLLKRLEDVSDAKDLKPVKTLIESVVQCQRGMATDRLDLIDDVLQNVPRSFFEAYGADAFYDDVVEVCDLVRQSLPEIVIRETVYGSGNVESLYSRIEKAVMGLSDNRFMQAESVRNFIELTRGNVEALRAYVTARDTLLGKPGQAAVETPETIADVTRTFAVLVSAVDGMSGMEAYVPFLDREKTLLCGRLAAWTSRIDLLGAVVDLAEVVDVDAAQLEAWRKRATAQRRAIDEQVRRLYREYRLKVRNEPKRAKEILDEILKASDADRKNPFRVWAEREMEKGTKKEVAR